jgi:thioredoxin-like negative regulator of GroEL
MSSIIEITEESFKRHVLRSELPVLVAVCANGSRSSQKLLTLLETWPPEASRTISVFRINAGASPDLAQRCGVPSAPGLALFHQGAVCYQFRGELSRLELDDLLAHASHLIGSSPPFAGESNTGGRKLGNASP